MDSPVGASGPSPSPSPSLHGLGGSYSSPLATPTWPGLLPADSGLTGILSHLSQHQVLAGPRLPHPTPVYQEPWVWVCIREAGGPRLHVELA